MLVFWLSAAALLLIVLGLVLKPLMASRHKDTALKTNPKQAGSFKRSWILLAGVAAVIVAVSVLLYVYSPGYQSMQRLQEGKQLAGELSSKVDSLELELKRQGGNQAQWLELASMQMLLRRPQRAVFAYHAADRLEPINDADTLVDFGSAILIAGATQPQELSEALALFERALEQAPEQQMALWFAGQISFQTSDFSAAVDYWQRMLRSIQGNDQRAESLRAEVNERLSLALRHMQAAQGEASADRPAETKQSPSFTIRISLDPALKDQLNPKDTLFVYARAVQGPPMPLAIKRLSAAGLPLTVQLSNSDAMIADMNLDTFSKVEIVARVSASGQAMPQMGDLMGVSAPQSVIAKNQSLELLIDEVFKP